MGEGEPAAGGEADEALRTPVLLGQVLLEMMRAVCGRWGFEGRVQVVREATEEAQGAMIEGGNRVAKALAGQRALRVSMAGNLVVGMCRRFGRKVESWRSSGLATKRQSTRVCSHDREHSCDWLSEGNFEHYAGTEFFVPISNVVHREQRHVHCVLESLLTHHRLIDHRDGEST